MCTLNLSRVVNERLAKHYGIPGIYGSHYRRVTLTDEARFGLLGKGAVLMVSSHTDRTSPVVRGKWVLDNLLGAPPPAPPANVPPLDENASQAGRVLTMRERMEAHRKNPACTSCHQLIDPLGFGFENYDHFGRFRSQENQLAIDASGAVVDSPDPSIDGPFSTPVELAERLGASEAVRDCLATHWYRFAMGRIEAQGDLCSIDHARSKFRDSDGDLRELLIALTSTDAFLYRPAMVEAE